GLYRTPGICSVLKLINKSGAQVQIIIAQYSVLDLIFNFHSVTVMNIITWSHAISLYPFSTFEMCLGLISNFTSTRARQQVIKKKYALRGFLLAYNPGYFFGVAEFHRGSRYVGNKYSWIIPL
ncbi:hypothetical protein ARMSODRAFT_843910, partial [Armillaria solidipes]